MRIIGKKIIPIIIFLNVILEFDLSSQIKDSEYLTVKSLDSIECKVYIIKDNANGRIIIKLNSNETLCINNFRGFEQKASILNNKFIELLFKLPGGTGTGVNRTVLICISKGKLYKALDVISMVNSVFKKTYDRYTDSLNLYDESTTYNVDFKLIQSKNKIFRLMVSEYEKVYSKIDPKQNHEIRDSLYLNFDWRENVFYSGFINLRGDFVIVNDNEGTTTNRIFKNNKYPTIRLRDAEYYFIDRSWFYRVLSDKRNFLTVFSDYCK